MVRTTSTPKPWRVLMVVENLPVPFDRRVWQEALALRDFGCDVSVICPKDKNNTSSYEVLDGITIYRHRLPVQAKGAAGFVLEYGAALFYQTYLAWRVFLTRGFDVIHAANPPDLVFLVAAPFKLFGRKFVFDHHDLVPELFVEKFKRKGIGYAVMLAMERLTFALADVVISTNASYRKVAIDRGHMAPDQVFVVRSGPDITRFKPVEPSAEIRARGKYIVGYIGIMGSQDGVDDLLDIIHLYVHDLGFVDTHFLLIGDGPEHQTLEARCQSLGLSPFVTFTGYLRGAALNQALSSIDIGVCPDPCNEYTTRCTMNKIMEYMAMGKALVQFDLLEGRYSAENAAAYARPGDFRDFADKIRLLVDDEALRHTMGASGYQRLIHHLQWRNEVPELLAAYQAIGMDTVPGDQQQRQEPSGLPVAMQRDGRPTGQPVAEISR
ncbi:MAG: glycosyltransferase family 4 protein [Azospirillaceae bacterium]|nr:glycosyltransferase family 4 protein [Azospirillaceae bacterium]